MNVLEYNNKLSGNDLQICNLLFETIDNFLTDAENKIWHGHPVWFINENPVVGYSKLKNCIQLLFWSGQSFGETNLKPTGKFKASEIKYTDIEDLNTVELERWLEKAKTIQWDYKNLVKRKGNLEMIK
jgi:hypothetical protein